MTEQHTTDIADRCSRKRAVLLAVLAVFTALVSGGLWRIYLGTGDDNHLTFIFWMVYAVVGFLVVFTGGALLAKSGVRSLMNDEVTRAHRQIALASGFLTAIIAAFAMGVQPASSVLPAHTAAYIMISSSLTVSLFVWAVLELRALRSS